MFLTRFIPFSAMLIRLFKKPLQSLPELISQEELSFLFSNLEELHDTHEKFLAAMEDLFSGRDPTSIGSQLGLLFLQMAPEWKNYSVYCNNYFIAMATLDKVKENKKFAQWLKVRLCLDSIALF